MSRVLVTGGAGSIGAALVGRLLSQGHTVCAFDNSEDALFNLGEKYSSDSNGRLKLFLGCIRDSNRVSNACQGVTDVYHCAAVKHVYLNEYNPSEALLTNITGTENIVNACIEHGVRKAVITSSDKCVNPTSTMGATKLLGERIFCAGNHHRGKKETKFCCVRFGNVLNTNGSVLKIFSDHAARGLDIPVRTGGMTRFFLTMDQAVDLCLYANSSMLGGEIFIADMGSAAISDLAEVFIESCGGNIRYCDPVPGEKIFEELSTETEASRLYAMGGYYVIRPEIIDLLGKDLVLAYAKRFADQQPAQIAIRSDKKLMSKQQIRRVLHDIRLAALDG